MAGNPIVARAAAEEGRDLADAIGDGWTSRQCRFALGIAQLFQGDLAGAAAQFAELVAEAEAAHEVVRRVASLAYQGIALAWQGDTGAARAAADAAVEAASELAGSTRARPTRRWLPRPWPPAMLRRLRRRARPTGCG